MITIQRLNQNYVTMGCHYAYRQRCHNIPGAEFSYDLKAWVAPLSSLSYIQDEFKGELYFKTPLWELKGEKAPQKSHIGFLGPEPEVPHLDLAPYSYQELGIKFMIDRLNNLGFCLNGDGVGLGKTIMATGTMKYFAENRGARKFLIICKKSIKIQWSEEIRRIAGWHNIPIFVTGSTKKKRMDAYKGIQEERHGILITNYHNFLNDFDEINKSNYDICIIDEAHCVKSKDGKMNALIGSTIKGKRTILLTGTPIMSKPDDIWGIVSMAAPNYFGEYEDFEKRYLVTEYGIYGKQIVGAKNLDELQDRIKAFMIMRTAQDPDVEIELPEAGTPRVIRCGLDETQEKMLTCVEKLKEDLDQKKKDLLDQFGATPEVRMEIDSINETSKMYIATMQFIANDPANFRYLEATKGINARMQGMIPKSYKMSEKTEATVDLVQEILASGGKVIIFTHFSSAARLLKETLEKNLSIGTLLYTGRESEEKREEVKRLFKEDQNANVLIANEAAAEGLNLQVAQYMIHYEQADTYAQKEQRIGRIRRIGSAFKHLFIYDIVTEGSFDEVKLRKIARDKRVAESLLS